MNNLYCHQHQERVVCKIVPAVEVDRDEWSITFSTCLYDFLKERVGDVHQWCNQQADFIDRGEMQFAPTEMGKIRLGHMPSQRTIGNLIRAYGMSLMLDSLPDF